MTDYAFKRCVACEMDGKVDKADCEFRLKEFDKSQIDATSLLSQALAVQFTYSFLIQDEDSS